MNRDLLYTRLASLVFGSQLLVVSFAISDYLIGSFSCVVCYFRDRPTDRPDVVIVMIQFRARDCQ